MKNNNNLLGLETYGKQNLPLRIYQDVKTRFSINQHSEALLYKRDIGCYIPKLNKIRFGLSIVIAVVCIITPFITPLSIPILLWGIK